MNFTSDGTGIKEIDEVLLGLWNDRHWSPDQLRMSVDTYQALRACLKNSRQAVLSNPVGDVKGPSQYINKYATLYGQLVKISIEIDNVPDGTVIFE